MIQTGSESLEEATNGSVENEAAVSEVLGERVPRGGQRPNGRRGEPAQRQQGVPVERVHLRISEEFCLIDLKLHPTRTKYWGTQPADVLPRNPQEPVPVASGMW